MLETILKAAGLDAQTYARLIGVSPSIFQEWVSGQRPIPESYVALLSDTLSVTPEVLLRSSKHAKNVAPAELTPAIWFKFRQEGLTGDDREAVVLIRQLGYFQNELEDVTGRKSSVWNTIFESIRRELNTQAPPVEQGRLAARLFREQAGLRQGATGIGPVFRGNLRSKGISVVESPLKGSRIEGCSFYVGSKPNERPCIFANTYRTTWFRRNAVLMHELAHALFDAWASGAALDYRESFGTSEICEQRAEAFAQEALVPREVLNHAVQTRGIKWAQLTSFDLACLVADIHVEKEMVLKAAVGWGMASEERAYEYAKFDIASELRELSPHALSTAEYLATLSPEEKEKRKLVGNRSVTIPSRSIRLPVPYVMSVVEAVRENNISKGKAAELLMIGEREWEKRFGELVGSNEY